MASSDVAQTTPAAGDDNKAMTTVEPIVPISIATNNIILGATLFIHILLPAEILPTNVAVVIVASVIVMCGAFRSLKPQSPVESITQKDAMQYPIVGSVVLFSLFIVLKFIPKYMINFVLNCYFCGLGVFALAATVLPLMYIEQVQKTLLPEKWRNKSIEFTIPKIRFINPEDMKVEFSYEEALSCILVMPAVIWYVITRHWISNNMLGVSFSLQAIEHIAIGSFQIGCILLIGLFFYDIFWVFGTPVMVTVAKGLDAPIKLLFPRPMGQNMSLLGLGDIVIPGIFIALLLRFDEHLCQVSNAAAEKAEGKSAVIRRSETYKKRMYFIAGMVGYFIGIATTLAVMILFDAAQPALLYIVPSVILIPLITAAAHKEVGLLFSFSDGERVNDTEEQPAEAKKDK